MASRCNRAWGPCLKLRALPHGSMPFGPPNPQRSGLLASSWSAWCIDVPRAAQSVVPLSSVRAATQGEARNAMKLDKAVAANEAMPELFWTTSKPLFRSNRSAFCGDPQARYTRSIAL
jgi:hypothetical protein